MLPSMLLAVFLSSLKICVGEAVCVKPFGSADFSPQYVQIESRFQIIAPDTPYVAASGPDKLYFIESRHTAAAAQHIKNQIEWALVPHPDTHIFLNEIMVSAEVRNDLDETLFVFDPPYARVLFAQSFNRLRPSLELPEHEDPGEWEVTYRAPSSGEALSLGKR